MPFPGPALGAIAVLLRTDAGLTGESLLMTVNDKRTAVLLEMVRSLEPLVIGADPTFSEAFHAKASEDTRHLGTSGVPQIGIGAIDGALLDLRAKMVGLPVHRLLGALRDRVPAYYSGGLWNQVGPDALQATASAIVAHGHRAMKLRVGMGSLDQQVERVRLVRETIGPDIKLMLDANQRLTAREAIRLGHEVEPFDLEWLEEPVAPHDHGAEAQIAAELEVPIAAGESVYSVAEFREVIDHRCVDVIMPDLQRIGGPLQFLNVARLAAAADMPFTSHLSAEMSLGLLATLPNAIFLEVMPWSQPLYAERVEIADGCAVASERPGWGYALDPQALARYAAE
jgi:L-alanine-DL-glutamate epimerase-like enolase superfamily enzyme